MATSRRAASERNGMKRVRIPQSAESSFDFTMLFLVLFLLCFGVVMIYSASSYIASMEGDSFAYVKKQVLAIVLGLVAMGICTIVDYHVWKRFAWLSYAVTIVCIILVKTPLGLESHGATRWIKLGPLSFQPAELAKLSIVLVCGVMLEKYARSMGKFTNLVRMVMIVGVIGGLIYVLTKNLSSAIIIMGIGVIMIFVVSPKYMQFIIPGVILVAAAGAFLMLKGGFRAERILVWLEPEQHAQEGGYQVMQGLYAIGSGGILGKGLGQSVQKLGYVPEAQNDMIFTIICEELGLVGALIVIVVFGVLIWRLYCVAMTARDLFGSLIAVGVLAQISLQVVLNIAVVTNSIPNTGVTLPFISYGGTSMLFLMIEMGLVLSVSYHRGGES